MHIYILTYIYFVIHIGFVYTDIQMHGMASFYHDSPEDHPSQRSIFYGNREPEFQQTGLLLRG